MKPSLKLFIVISVLLNILLIALVVGHEGRRLLGSPTRYSYTDLAIALPEHGRELFINTMQRADDESGEWQKQADNARRQSTALLKAEPFDKQAYLAQLQIIEDMHDRIAGRMSEAILSLAQQFTPEERAALAELILKRRSSMMHSHRDPSMLPGAALQTAP